MCTVIQKEQLPKIAEKDIEVYKLAQVKMSDTFMSAYKGFCYKAGKEYRTEFTFSNIAEQVSDSYELKWRNITIPVYNRRYVMEGFHSYNSIKRLKLTELYSYSVIIGLFIIPKGATYYENGAGNIVSNRLIFKNYVD